MCLLTGVHHARELDFLHRPPTVTSTVDGPWVDLELIGVVEEQHAHPTQGINEEMQQIIIVPGDGVVPDYGEADVFVDQGEQFAHVLLQILERVPDVHLRRVLAVGRWVLEFKAITFPRGRVADNSIAIAATIRVDET